MLALFDSGFGGLTVAKAIRERFPELDLGYLGDSARAPYGDKDPETILGYLREAVDFLFSRGAGMVIVACNTASTTPLRRLQIEQPDRKILGVLVPTAEAAAGFDRIGVIGTAGTIRSGEFTTKIRAINPAATVTEVATPLLVPLIEELLHDQSEAFTRRLIREYLTHFDFLQNPVVLSEAEPSRKTSDEPPGESGQVGKKIDALVLGCTHYPIIRREIEAELPPGVRIIDSASATADRLGDYLTRHPDVAENLTRNGGLKIWTTGSAGRFAELGSRILGEAVRPEVVRLG